MPDVIVPRKCVTEIRKLLDEAEGNVEISLSASKIRFQLGKAILTSKLIDGTFPDYSRVIPTANDKLLKVDPKSLYQGVDRVSTIASEKTRAVKVGLDKDRITLSVTSPENGTAAEEVAAVYDCEAMEIGFKRPLPQRHPGSGRWRHGRTAPGRRQRPDADPREREEPGAVRADADAGLTSELTSPRLAMRASPASRNE